MSPPTPHPEKAPFPDGSGRGAFPQYTTAELRRRSDELSVQMHFAISPITYHAEKKLVGLMRAEIERRSVARTGGQHV